MKELIKALLKILLKIIIAVAIISVIGVLIWHFFGFALTRVFLYLGVACIFIGVLSVSGNSSIAANANSSYVQASTLNYDSNDRMAKEFLKFRDSSFGFVLFMSAVGGILIGVSYILKAVGF